MSNTRWNGIGDKQFLQQKREAAHASIRPSGEQSGCVVSYGESVSPCLLTNQPTGEAILGFAARPSRIARYSRLVFLSAVMIAHGWHTAEQHLAIDLERDIHKSVYKVMGVEVGAKDRDASTAGDLMPVVHWSVREKMKRNPDYRPVALAKHITDWATFAPYDVDESDRDIDGS